jgi:microcystin degradation protein MlrC
MTEAIRIAVLNFVHETVTFLPNDTTLADFVHEGSPARGEALLAWEPRSYMGGFVKVAREHAGVELVGIESPLWPRTGTGSGWITTEAYEHFLGRMLAELEDGGRWHGVYLALHGAMGVRGVISEYLTQVMDPLDLKLAPGFTIDQFKVFTIKSRVHFRRGFDDSGFAKTILLTEPEQPFLGTVRLEALPYRNVDISKFYPYGDVRFPE